MRNYTVTFHTNTYGKRKEGKKGFQLPVEVAHLLGDLSSGSEVALTITKPTGELIFHGKSKLTSGTEVARVDVSKHLGYNEEIRVTASKP